MEAEEIKRLCYANPFRPFSMKLRDGRTVLVGDSYATAFPPDGRRIYVGQMDGSTEFVRFDDVVSVEFQAPVNRRKAS